MATIIYGDKEIKKIETIEVFKRKNLCPSTVIIADGDYLTKIEIPGNINLFLEVKGNVTDLESTNSACVVGNIQCADVNNIAKVEGKIERIKGCAPILDKDLRVTTGRQYIYQSAAIEALTFNNKQLDIEYWDNKPFDTVKVFGNIKKITYNADSFPIILGDVEKAKINNLLSVKGDIKELNTKNRVFYTNEAMPEIDFRDVLIKQIDKKTKYDEYKNNYFHNAIDSMEFEYSG